MLKYRVRDDLIEGLTEIGYSAYPFKKGDLVWFYDGATYGIITPSGIPVTYEWNKTPFYEIPYMAVEEIA